MNSFPTARFLSEENSHVQIYSEMVGKNMREFNRDGTPPYDHLSLMPLTIRVYDNPIMAEELGDTAFVINETGEVYMYAPFVDEMAKVDALTAKTQNPTTNVRFIICHELMHQYLKHISLKGTNISLGFEPVDLNIAEDTKINEVLCLGYKLNISGMFETIFDPIEKVIVQGFYGTTEAEAEVFGSASMIEVAKHYRKHRIKQEQKEDKDKKEQKSESGKGPGKGSGGQGDEPSSDNNDPSNEGSGQSENNKNNNNSDDSTPADDSEKAQRDNSEVKGGSSEPVEAEQNSKAPDKRDGGHFGTDHVRNLQDVIDAMNKAGLGHVAEAFGYPKPDSNGVIPEKDLKEMEEQQAHTMGRVNAMANEIRSRTGKGGPMFNFAEDLYKASKPRGFSIELETNNFVSSFGGDLVSTDAEYGRAYTSSMNEKIFGYADMPPEGIHAPLRDELYLMFVIDSSGSMTDGNRLSEALACLKSAVLSNSHISGVFVSFSDTSSRKVQLYSSDELHDLENFEVSGFGGTDMAASLATSIAVAADQEMYYEGIVLVTDGDDYNLASRMDEVNQIAFKYTGEPLKRMMCIIPPGCGADFFVENMKPYAECAVMDEDGNDLDAAFTVETDFDMTKHRALSI